MAYNCAHGLLNMMFIRVLHDIVHMSFYTKILSFVAYRPNARK